MNFVICALVLLKSAFADTANNKTIGLNLTDFSQEMFWDEPPEGLFEVDVGLQ